MLFVWQLTSIWRYIVLGGLLRSVLFGQRGFFWFLLVFLLLIILWSFLSRPLTCLTIKFLSDLYKFRKDDIINQVAKFILDNRERYNMHWSESLSSQELKITGKEALNLVKGLSSITSFKILQLLSKENLDVSSIARRMKLSEAHISGEISRLEDLRLVKFSYEPGKRGIRKVCMLAVKQISIMLINN